MARVICKRPNASDEISGVRFTRSDDGMLSDEISDEQAAAFTEIPGFQLVEDSKAARAAAEAQEAAYRAAEAAAKEAADQAATWQAEAAAAAAAARAADDAAKRAAEADAEKKDDAGDDLKELTAQAEALGIDVKSTWKAQRLTAEIARAKSK